MVLRHSANIPANPTAHLSGWFQRHTKLRVVHRWLQLTGTVLTYRHAPQSSAEWIVDLRDCTVSAGRRAKEIVLIRPACKPLSLYAVSMDELKVWFSEMKRVSDNVHSFYHLSVQTSHTPHGPIFLARDRASNSRVCVHALPKVALPLTKLTLLAQRNAVVIRATQKHECLLTVIDAFETSTLFHIVTEHTAGPPLCDIEADVSTARDIIRDVLSGLAYLHEKGMIHGAVVSENVLLSKVSFPCRAKLVTFGCASGKSEMGACGRDDDAPEVICFHRRGAASDIFSTGVLLHRLLVGREPFSGSGDEYLGAVSKGISSEGLGGAARILREMLADQESVRPSAQDCLEDAWFAAPLLNEKKDGEDKPGTLARRGSDPKTVIMDFEGGLAKRRSVSFAEEGAHGSPACPASPASPASLVSLPSVKSPRSSLS